MRRNCVEWCHLAALIMVFVIMMGCGEKGSGQVTAPAVSTSWNLSPPLLQPEEYIFNLLPISKDNIWAVGTYGKIFNYDGKEWKPVQVPPEARGYALFDLFFPSPDNGWAVGEAMVIPQRLRYYPPL